MSPSTASFPWLDREVRSLGNDVYQVISYVDAQNGFGATVRSNYSCKVRYRGGEDADQNNWEAVEITLSSR